MDPFLPREKHKAAKPTRSATVDDEEQLRRRHAEVQRVFTPRDPTDLAIRRSTTTSFLDQNHSHEEADEEVPRHGNGSRSVPPPESSPQAPTTGELDRWERWMALQERMAKCQRQGNKYGKLTVQDQGRAIRGDIFDEEHPETQLFARIHEYGDGQVKDNARVLDATLPSGVARDFYNRKIDEVPEK